jgi:tetratricopeptide (TPR) repeat protein
MFNKTTLSPQRQMLIVYIFLALVTLAVFWQVTGYNFVNFDDPVYVTENSHIHGITINGVRWAFSSTYAEFWHPLTWLSLMFDYQLYGLNAGGYHLTNLILHILSSLLLFWLFNRMTGMIWRSAFVAALFALHPLHVESVAWIAERKDVLSAFFWMLTLCLYVYYTEKPAIRRYLLVLFSFVCALMSKPMVVTLPLIMILLDYWPLKRFESKKENWVLWQFKEKFPLFTLSAVFSIITLLAQHKMSAQDSSYPLGYLAKTFWPQDLAIFYPFPNDIPLWQVLGATILIIVISAFVIIMLKRLPYLFAGWLWFAITMAPVIGIIQINSQAMADRYHYLPSVGIAVILAWGLPLLFSRDDTRRKILFPAAIASLLILSVLTWQQCGYWKNSVTIFQHALLVTKNNYLAHSNLASALAEEGKLNEAIDHYNEAIRIIPHCAEHYYNRGLAYVTLGQHKKAIDDFNQAVNMKPDYFEAYLNKGAACGVLGQYQPAIDNFSEAIRLQPDYIYAYYNRGFAYFMQGRNKSGCSDLEKVCELGNCQALDLAKSRNLCR